MAIINAALMHSDASDSFEKDLQRALWKWNMGNSEPMRCYNKDKPDWTKTQRIIEWLIIQSCSVQTQENMMSFKPPPSSCAASTVQGKKIWKKQNIWQSEDHSVTSRTLPLNSANRLGVSVMRLQEWQQNLQRETLPFILFHLLASQVFSKG